MAKRNEKSLAKQTAFCVWADHIDRVYQTVDAESPKQAFEIAKERSECWERCGEHTYNGYRLSNEVQDIDTGEFFPVCATKHCRTCGSEIVETINESNFRDGECGPCEYERYKTQPMLMAASQAAYSTLRNLGNHRCFRWTTKFNEGNEVLGHLSSAIKAYGEHV